MPHIENPQLEQYKRYLTEPVKGKDGVTRPVTKCYYVKTCPECGDLMKLDYKKAIANKRSAIIKWNCPDRICKYTEVEENLQERSRRISETTLTKVINQSNN